VRQTHRTHRTQGIIFADVPLWLGLLGGEDPIIMLVILVLLPLALVVVGRGVAGAIEIVLDSFVVFA